MFHSKEEEITYDLGEIFSGLTSKMPPEVGSMFYSEELDISLKVYVKVIGGEYTLEIGEAYRVPIKVTNDMIHTKWVYIKPEDRKYTLRLKGFEEGFMPVYNFLAMDEEEGTFFLVSEAKVKEELDTSSNKEFSINKVQFTGREIDNIPNEITNLFYKD